MELIPRNVPRHTLIAIIVAGICSAKGKFHIAAIV
jgi:hypothetical protein